MLIKNHMDKQMISKIIQIMGTDTKFFGYEYDSYFLGLENHVGGNQVLLNLMMEKPHDSVMLDIGANIGLTAAIAARIFHSGKVIAIEPTPMASSALSEMVRENGFNNIQIMYCGAGKEIGNLFFNESQFLAGSYICSENESNSKIKVVPTDIIVDILGLNRLDIVKIDVEGFELDVLEGMVETIKKFKPKVVAEFNSFALACNRKISPYDLGEYILEKFGKFQYLNGEELKAVKTVEQLRQFIYWNMVSGSVTDIAFEAC